MNRCPDLVVCLKRDLQCLRPEESLVLIYRPNVSGMKGRVDLRSPLIEPQTYGVEALYTTTRSYSIYHPREKDEGVVEPDGLDGNTSGAAQVGNWGW
ncbi:hypothetical protein TNCV_2403751 [Trichonephila clavipes]|uniref:Uncharacterized protein n=1 Tax=Trichonephila clavipes TaxID=2585209 RepID=A0A8X6R618_TRICX|nr:hypothetical protein TNCV_2403751 [Trichonephila clavipes]